MSALNYVGQNDVTSLRILCTQARSDPQKTDIEVVDSYGNTALLKACYLGKLECVDILLQSGANIRAVNYFGQNALTLATYSGSLSLVKHVLRYRSYDDFNESSIIPPLCVAALRQDKRIFQYFKNLSGGKNAKTAHGLYPEDIFDMLKKEVPQRHYANLKI